MKQLPDNWREIITDMFSNGAHVSEVMKALGFSREVHDRFYRQQDEYRTAFQDGKMLAEAWWAEQGRTNVGNKNFNNQLFIFMMKSVFKWRDNHPDEKKDESHLDDEEKRKLLKKYKMDVEQAEELN